MTKLEWFEKLKNFLPSWVFAQDEPLMRAHFMGLASCLEALDEEAREHLKQTFIETSTEDFLDAHGGERGILRSIGEYDRAYQARVRSLSNQSNFQAIKRLVDSLLIRGQCQINEDWNEDNFFGRANFFDRASVFISPVHDSFSIIVSKQIREPESFYSQGVFANRGGVFGSNESSLILFELIMNAVNQAKAAGTFYRIIERGG